MQTKFQPGCYIHECTNEMHSLAYLQDLITTLAAYIHIFIMAAKVELNLVDLIESVFHLCMHKCNYPVGIASV